MITPQEASKKNDQIHAQQLKAAEEKIDRALARGYFSGGKVTVDTKNIDLDYHLREKLMDKYRKAGWKVEHHSDQRDQTSYMSFTANTRDRYS
jgi:macrodomain Ter protein organizer (MatP/YcbG family)